MGNDRITLGISSCLVGHNVRYDGGHKHDRWLTEELGRYVDWVPVCPEVECGLPIPRETMRLVGTADDVRLISPKSGTDHTPRMQAWIPRRLEELEEADLQGFVFQRSSPSSGMTRIKVYDANGVPAKTGVGIWARAFIQRFPLLPVEDDGRLHDPGIRDNFITRIFVLQRWRALEVSRGALVDFHARHKLLLMAHSSKHLTAMGRLVARAGELPLTELRERYLGLLMPALQLKATVAKNTNVLQHAAGYFKKDLDSADRQELADVIMQYHDELVPLIVPVTLLKHYTRKFEQPYLGQQVFLDPHPLELRLRNYL